MATLKELSKREEVFVSGHRLCAGCGAGIIMRMVMRAQELPIVAAISTGCVEVSSVLYPYSSWKCSFIHNAFENSAATMSGVETAYRALKKKGKIKEDIRFIAFGGDGGTYDIGLQSLSGAMERGHRMLYLCYNNEAYMNCLSTDSLIMTKDGIRKITDIKEGDEVYAFNQKTYQLVSKKCTGVFDNGKKEVFELSTLHHSIKATANHPFLVLKRNGRGKHNGFVWKTLAEVKVGDEVVALKRVNTEKPFTFGKIDKVKKGDYKVNRLNEVNLPEDSSPDLMKYLGLFVGDGWVRNGRGEIGFAMPNGSRGRQVLVEVHNKLFATKLSCDENYVSTSSVNMAKFIKSLDFGSGAKTKKIPGWVFTLTQEEKEAFLDGLLLSDGYKVNGSARYVSASDDLLKSLRLLLQTMNYRVGKIHHQEKKQGTMCVYRKLLKDSRYGYICFSKKKEKDIKKYPSQYRYQNFLIGNKYFETEKVRSIKSVGIEPTLDLRVEDEHNFIADGIVVHNTGVQRSSATPKGASTTTTPPGAVSSGKKEFMKDLTQIMVAHRIPYVAQASPSHWNDLVTKVQKALSVDGPSFINVLSPCPLGWRHPDNVSVEMARIPVECCFWPLYEVENGKYKLNYKPEAIRPITDWLTPQGRFRHLNEPQNKHIIDDLQAQIKKDWEELLIKCGGAKQIK